MDTPDDPTGRVGEACCAAHNGIQNRLHLSGRRGNHSQDLTGSSLLLQRFGERATSILSLADERGFSRRIEGPELSDAAGWSAPPRFRSIRLADVNGDALADLCARHADGLRCSLSTGHGFERTWLATSWDDSAFG